MQRSIGDFAAKAAPNHARSPTDPSGFAGAQIGQQALPPLQGGLSRPLSTRRGCSIHCLSSRLPCDVFVLSKTPNNVFLRPPPMIGAVNSKLRRVTASSSMVSPLCVRRMELMWFSPFFCVSCRYWMSAPVANSSGPRSFRSNPASVCTLKMGFYRFKCGIGGKSPLAHGAHQYLGGAQHIGKMLQRILGPSIFRQAQCGRLLNGNFR